ncbi:MAG: 5-formyltetrahydrofolate cyclo-ligase [Micromonosporaceae bacterium]|nr:5-formyltetrahydrofolate cyclo-ligase [Micromonosporaceae bacterium]
MSDTGQLPGPGQGKAPVRARILEARRALPEQVRAAAARRVQAVLCAAVAAARPDTITGYVPIGTEPGGPDLPAALAGALGPGGRLLLPVLRPDRALDWVVYQPPAGRPLSATDPPGPRLGVAALRSASLVVVPAFAVDRRGVRLGRGGGSYDRALATVSPGTQVVALLHDGELLDQDLPAEPHDQRVSAVITPALGLLPLPAG